MGPGRGRGPDVQPDDLVVLYFRGHFNAFFFFCFFLLCLLMIRLAIDAEFLFPLTDESYCTANGWDECTWWHVGKHDIAPT